jgi:hypothetical protein
MGNFFTQAVARNTEQKRFLEAAANRRHVIASFPLGYPAVSLYAFAVMLGSGMAVAVAPDIRAIRRNLDYFRAAGVQFPDIAFLDGTQMPHEERAIRDAINHHRVRLLYTTPERFTGLTFLEILVRTEIAFLVVEEADRLLPVSPGYTSYKRLWTEGLSSLRRLPPLLLITSPLSAARLRELSEKLHLDGVETIEHQPRPEGVEIWVKRLWSEQGKFQRLTDALAGYPGRGRLGNLERTGPVLIQAGAPPQAEKLGASLIDYGFQSVRIVHARQSAQEQQDALAVARLRPDTIVVNGGVQPQDWLPPRRSAQDGVRAKIVYWMPPTGLDELFATLFRHLSEESVADPAGNLQSLILYTKEDFHRALHRLRYDRKLDFTTLHERSLALKRYRRWILSEGCRLQTLFIWHQGSEPAVIPPCGHCDYCLSPSRPHPFFQLVRRWFF